MNVTHFEIEEREAGDRLCLVLKGELDLAAAPVLHARLSELRQQRRAVRLDLSRLEFIDSSGVHVLMRALNHARTDGWQLEIGARLSPPVRRIFELVQLDRVLVEEDGEPDLASRD